MVRLHKVFHYFSTASLALLLLPSPGISSASNPPENVGFLDGEIRVQNPSFIDKESQLKRTLIHSEVDHTLRRLNPFLNTWILAAIVVPSAISVTILIWFFREAQHVQICRQTVATEKENIRDRIEYLASEAQDILDELQLTMNVTEEKIEAIESHIQSLSIKDEKDSDFSVDHKNEA